MIPWERGKQLVRDVAVLNTLAHGRLNQGSLFNPGTTATECEARKIEKYRELTDSGHVLQSVALNVQGYSGGSSEYLVTRLCRVLCRSNDDQQSDIFGKQRIPMGLLIGNPACVLGTVSDKDVFEEINNI